MLELMDNKKRRVGRPNAEKPRAVSFATRGTEDHLRALKAQIADTRRTASIEILLAIEAWLAQHGRWPPAKAKGKT